jgi:hypothetical protein
LSKLLVSSYTDGPVLTAAAAASCIPTYNVITLQSGYFFIGRQLRLTLTGRASVVVTTPGTLRFDVRLGGTVVFDSLAITPLATAQTNKGFWLDILLTCQAVGSGTLTKFMGQGNIRTEILLTEHGHGSNMMLPVATAPAQGAGVSSVASLALDVFFTQTVATGSLTVHQYAVEQLDDGP